ncbi:hypothetical protein N9K52_02385 [Litoricolaceae bacterium]|nr:hypothetical protein [Litorivicinaceae bacterium]
MFGFLKKGNANASKEDRHWPPRQIKPIFELQEEFLVKLLAAMYVGSEKMDADPQRFNSANLPPEWNTVQDLYRLIRNSGLTDYPTPPKSDQVTWERIFFISLFPISWNIAHHLGIQADEGYIFDETSPAKPQLSLELDKAIGWMRHSDSRLENLAYWALHGQATGGEWPSFIERDFQSIISEYASKVDFSYKGSVIRTSSNVIYVWKALGRDSIDGKYLCKIGITNVAGGEGRLLQVAKSNGFNAEVVVFNMVGEKIALDIERKLLKLGTKPNSHLNLGDGKTEFRYLSDDELSSIPRIIFSIQEEAKQG